MLRQSARLAAIAFLLSSLGTLTGCANLSPAKIPFVTTNSEIEAQIAMARMAEQGNDYDRAKQIYDDVLKKRPKNVAAHHRLAVIAAREERPERADEYFAKARALTPNDPELLADIGYQHFLQRRLPEAEEALRVAIEADPRHQRSLNNLGLVMGHQGRFDEALVIFRRGGTDAEAHANLAFVLAFHGRYEEAKRNYSIALSRNPGLKVAAEALVELNKVVPDYQPQMQQPGMIAGAPGAPGMPNAPMPGAGLPGAPMQGPPGMPGTPAMAAMPPAGVAPAGAMQPYGTGMPNNMMPAQPVPFHQPLGAPTAPAAGYPAAPIPTATAGPGATTAAALMPAGSPAEIAPYPTTTPSAPEMLPMAPPADATVPTNVTALPPVGSG